MNRLTSAMIVSEDEMSTNFVTNWLRSGDFCNVIQSTNTAQAFQELTEGPACHLVVIDLGMRQNAAIPFIQLLAQHDRPDLRAAAMVVMTGHVEEAQVAAVGESPVLGALLKPLTETRLKTSLAPIISDLQNERSERWTIRETIRLIAEGNFEPALSSLRTTAEANPRNARVRLLIAQVLIAMNQSHDAIPELNAVIKAIPTSPAAKTLLAKILILEHRFEDAIRLLQQAQATSPLNIERPTILGELALALGKPAVAEEKFRSVLKLCPGCLTARRGLAKALIEQGRTNELAKLTHGRKDYDDLVSHFNIKGVVLAREQHFQKAIQMYECAAHFIANPPKEAAIRFNMALAYMKSGQKDKAASTCERALRLDPTHTKAASLLDNIRKGKSVDFLPPQIPAPSDRIPVILPDDKAKALVNCALAGSTPITQEQYDEIQKTTVHYNKARRRM